MAPRTRLVVEIEELGLDGRRDVLKLLNEATAEDHVEWTAVEVAGEPHQGAADILFEAVTAQVVEHILVKIEAAVEPWCRRGLEKVRHRVSAEPVEPADPVEPAEAVEAGAEAGAAVAAAGGSGGRPQGDEA